MNPNEIRTYRTNLGLSQSAVAERLDVAQPTISNWESGKTTPSDEQIRVLKAVLGIDDREPKGDLSISPETYGEWLTRTRSEKGLSRGELAAKSGVSAPQIGNIETGITANPRPSTQAKLGKALSSQPSREIVRAAEREAEIEDVGQFLDFDPHDESDFPPEPGVYVFYDISNRPIYIGQSQDIKSRIRTDHTEKFWYKVPIVQTASYVRVEDKQLRQQLERTLIKFLKSNAVINKQLVDY